MGHGAAQQGGGENLEFDAVVQGKNQVVDGVNYHLVIQCMDSLGTPLRN
jgi:hypothetical protein